MVKVGLHSWTITAQEEEKDEDEWCNVIADQGWCQLMTDGGSHRGNGTTEMRWSLLDFSHGGQFNSYINKHSFLQLSAYSPLVSSLCIDFLL